VPEVHQAFFPWHRRDLEYPASTARALIVSLVNLARV
jgi:hypothetical protein